MIHWSTHERLLKTYEHVTMTDMNNLIGNQSEYSDCKYGWTSYRLRLAYVGTLGPDAYSIHMPAYDWFYDETGSSTAKSEEKMFIKRKEINYD